MNFLFRYAALSTVLPLFYVRTNSAINKPLNTEQMPHAMETEVTNTRSGAVILFVEVVEARTNRLDKAGAMLIRPFKALHDKIRPTRNPVAHVAYEIGPEVDR